jgi:L-alanine-DL-glutamate epimerase-like enolase superfamily enzyme
MVEGEYIPESVHYCGVQVVAMVEQAGLQLMIGGMVETRLAMGFAAHMAAGLGCFR